MDNEFFINDELDQYIDELNKSHIETFKKQFQFSNNLQNFKETNEYEDFNFLKHFTTPCLDNKYKSYYKNNKTNTNNYTKKQIVYFSNNSKKSRISKSAIKSRLEYYYLQNPSKWDKDYIEKISNLTNLPKGTVYKWNWNEIKKNSKDISKEIP